MKANVYRLLVGAACLAACGGRYPQTSPARPGPAGAEESPVVENAALPYRVLDARGGGEISAEELYRRLAGVDAVCIGEEHPNPHHHWAQLHLVDQLSGRADDRVLALGMEMFQRPFQGVLDDFGAGRIDDATLVSRSDWANRWGFDYALYRPILHKARERGAALLALNVARELLKKVSGQGISKLSAADRARLPEMDLEDAEHRAWFDGVMAALAAHGHGHGQGHGKAHGDSDDHGADDGESPGDRIYAAQVLWDETMAETGARWLAAGPDRQLYILAGNGHCHDSAIVRRMQRRGVASVVSVQPIVDDGQGNVAAALAEPMNDYLFVMQPGD